MVVNLEETVRELTPGLIRYCTARTKDRGLAEEIAQESLVCLVQRWRKHGAPDCPEAFVFTVARRRAGRVLFARRLWLPLQFLAEKQDLRPDPEAAAMPRSGYQSLLDALEKLPARDREAILI